MTRSDTDKDSKRKWYHLDERHKSYVVVKKKRVELEFRAVPEPRRSFDNKRTHFQHGRLTHDLLFFLLFSHLPVPFPSTISSCLNRKPQTFLLSVGFLPPAAFVLCFISNESSRWSSSLNGKSNFFLLPFRLVASHTRAFHSICGGVHSRR